jgi:hypothetical protein
MLGGEVLVGEVGSYLVGVVEQLDQVLAEPGFASVGAGQFGHGFVRGVAHRNGIQAEFPHERQNQPFRLAYQPGEQVIWRDFGVGVGSGAASGGVDRFLRLQRPRVGIETHGVVCLSWWWIRSVGSVGEDTPGGRASDDRTGVNKDTQLGIS